MSIEKLKEIDWKLDGLCSHRWINSQVMAFEESMRADNLAMAKRLRPRVRKWTENKVAQTLPTSFLEWNLEFYRTFVDGLLRERDEEIERLRELAFEIALDLTPPSGDEWITVGEYSSSTYATQGFGAKRYARKAAEKSLLKAQLWGIPTRVEVRNERNSGGRMYSIQHAEFEAQIQGCRETALILKYKPSPTLKEVVDWCWANGVNPRVYYPTLSRKFDK